MARGRLVLFKIERGLFSVLEGFASGDRKFFLGPLTTNPRSDVIREIETVWMQAQGVDGDQALLAAEVPAYAAIGMIDWPGGSAAAILARRHLGALETFRRRLP